MRPPAPQVRRLQATPHTHFFRKGGGTLNMASLCTVKPYKTPTHPPPPTHGSCPFPPQTLHQRRILRAVRREGMCAEELRYADNPSIASLCATAGRPLSSTPRTPPDVLAPPSDVLPPFCASLFVLKSAFFLSGISSGRGHVRFTAAHSAAGGVRELSGGCGSAKRIRASGRRFGVPRAARHHG